MPRYSWDELKSMNDDCGQRPDGINLNSHCVPLEAGAIHRRVLCTLTKLSDPEECALELEIVLREISDIPRLFTKECRNIVFSLLGDPRFSEVNSMVERRFPGECLEHWKSIVGDRFHPKHIESFMSNMYKQRSFPRIIEVYEMLDPGHLTTFTMNIVIKTYSILVEFTLVDETVAKMKALDIKLDAYTYAALIGVYSRQLDIEGARQVLVEMEENEVALDYVVIGAFLKVCFGTRRYDEAVSIFELMEVHNLVLTEYIMFLFLRVCLGQQKYDEAIFYFETFQSQGRPSPQMEKADNGISPELRYMPKHRTDTNCIMIEVYAKMKRYAEMNALNLEMQELNLKLNNRSRMALRQATLKSVKDDSYTAVDIEKAVASVSNIISDTQKNTKVCAIDLKEKLLEYIQDSYHFSTLAKKIIVSLFGDSRLGHVNHVICKALSVHDKRLGTWSMLIKKELDTYTIAMACLNSVHQYDLLLSQYKYLLSTNIELSIFVFIPIIKAHSFRNEVEEIERTCEKVKSLGIHRDIRFMNSIVRAFSRCRDFTGARKAFDEALSLGLTPDSYTFNAMFSACDACRNYDEALLIVKIMDQHDIPMNKFSYRPLICLCNSLDKRDEAILYFDEYIANNLPPDKAIYLAMIEVYERSQLLDQLKRVKEELAYSGLDSRYCRSSSTSTCSSSSSSTSDDDHHYHEVYQCATSFTREQMLKIGKNVRKDELPQLALHTSFCLKLNPPPNETGTLVTVKSARIASSIADDVIASCAVIIQSTTEFQECALQLCKIMKSSAFNSVAFRLVSDAVISRLWGDDRLGAVHYYLPDSVEDHPQALGNWTKSLDRKVSESARQMIELNRSKRFENVVSIYEYVISNKLNPTTFVFVSTITALSMLRKYRKVDELLETLKTFDIALDIRLYNALLKVCARSLNISRAKQLLVELYELKLVPTDHTYSILLDICEKCRDYHEAIRITELMRLEGVQKSVFAYSSLISMCGKMWKTTEAISYFDELKKDGLTPDRVIYSVMISVYEKSKMFDEAMKLVDEMEVNGVNHNIISYNSLISVCEKTKKLDKALYFFDRIKQANIVPDIYTYNGLISCCSRSATPKLALKFYEEMQARGLKPDLYTYSGLISACEKAGLFHKGISLFDELKVSGLTPNVVIYGNVINNCVRAHKFSLALKYFEEMEHAGVTPNAICFNYLISICFQNSDWSGAQQIFRDMHRRNILPNEVTYSSMLSVAYACHELEAVVEYYGIIGSCGFIPDFIGLSNTVDSLIRLGRSDEAAQLFHSRQQGLSCSSIDEYNILLSICDKLNLYELGMEVFSTLKHSDAPPTVVSYNIMIRLSGRSGKPDSAIAYFHQVELLFRSNLSSGRTGLPTYSALIDVLYLAGRTMDCKKYYIEALDALHTSPWKDNNTLDFKGYSIGMMKTALLVIFPKEVSSRLLETVIIVTGAGLLNTPESPILRQAFIEFMDKEFPHFTVETVNKGSFSVCLY